MILADKPSARTHFREAVVEERVPPSSLAYSSDEFSVGEYELLKLQAYLLLFL